MDVLVTTFQLDHFGDRFRAAAPEARFLAMDPDGTIRAGEEAIAWEDVSAEVAFASSDLFDGDLRDDKIRHFFGWLIRAAPDPDAGSEPGDDTSDQRHLKWMHIAAAGVDSPVFAMLLERGLCITTSHHTATPISEYVMAQVLRARLPLDAMESDRRERIWRTQEWDELASSRWLVVGMGAIGTAVAERARSFGAHVTGVRRSPTGDEPVDAMIGPDAVVEAVADHEIVVLCLPATSATSGMVDAELLSRMGDGTLLVNVGRGALIDEDALRRSLDQGIPAVAILDVAVDEPPADDHWLWDHPTVVLTSHTSAGGRQRHERAADVFAANLVRYVDGEALADEVDLTDR